MFKAVILFGIFMLYRSSLIEKVVAATEEKDFFSSVADLKILFNTEVQLLTEMQNYVTNLQQQVDILQNEVNLIHQEHDEALIDLEGYLSNPINAYRLIKRLHIDWPSFEGSVTAYDTRTTHLKNVEILKQDLSFPTENDMIGSTLALVRLQETYQLDVSQVASGILNGIKHGSSMTWQDCYLVGEYLFSLQDYNHTIPWLKQSTKMLMSGYNDSRDETTLDFLETIAEYHKVLGDFETALELIAYILEHDDTRQSALETKLYLDDRITKGRKEGLMYQNSTIENPYHNTNEYKLYEKICRGEFQNLPHQQQTQLFCRLHDNNHPYRLLQPYKLEELSIDPYLIIVYDVVTDNQMEVIKEIAQPNMERSAAFTQDGKNSEISFYRTSKTVWLKYEDHKYTEEWLQHVNDLTGLNTKNAEDLQVANYGLGGHYEPHFDFFTDDFNVNDEAGNRISTAIFYLADVEKGGGTAFPFLDILVKPRKGALLFWYNLHPSGDGDYRTKHAACPVLKGSKWIANVWLRELDQFNRRLCDLTTNHEVSISYMNYN